MPAPPPAPSVGLYVVRAGDTIIGIARAHGLDPAGLCAANRLPDCSLIYPGETLRLTTAKPPVRAVRAPPPARPASNPPKPAPPKPATTTAAATPGFGCAAALAYLAAHQAPGFTDVCAPHSAFGAYGATCWHHPPQCNAANGMTIFIACPAFFVYANEAGNSQPPVTQRDLYGEGTAAQDKVCNAYA